MTGIFVASQWMFFPPLPPDIQSWKYATDVLIVKIDDAGDPIWTLPIRLANTTSKLVVSHNFVDVVECRDGGYAVASPILNRRIDASSLGIMLTRISDAGAVLWSHAFENISIEMGLSLVETQNESLALVGTFSFFDSEANAWNRDVFLWNFNEEGQIKWTRTFDISLNDRGYSLVECSSGGYAISGTTDMPNEMKRDILLIRTDEDGSLLWNKTIGDKEHNDGLSIAECDDGGFVVAGSTQNQGDTHKVLIVRTDAGGNNVWNCTHNRTGDDVALSLCDIGQDRFAITGFRRQSATSSIDTLFLLIESDGVISQSSSLYYDAWNRVYHYFYECEGHKIIQSHDGNLTIIGSVKKNSWSNDWDIMLMRIDTLGNLISNSTYGGGSWETGCSIITSGDGGYTLAGVRISLIERGLQRLNLSK
jgi:hypothetical protein